MASDLMLRKLLHKFAEQFVCGGEIKTGFQLIMGISWKLGTADLRTVPQTFWDAANWAGDQKPRWFPFSFPYPRAKITLFLHSWSRCKKQTTFLFPTPSLGCKEKILPFCNGEIRSITYVLPGGTWRRWKTIFPAFSAATESLEMLL